MLDVANLKQDAANAQVVALHPLMTLRLPADSTGGDKRALRFQVRDRQPFVFGGNTFEFLDARVDDVAGSQTPYSPYLYRIVINNSNRGGTINVNSSREDTKFDAIRDFISDNKGLRNGSFHIFYHYPDRTQLDRESVFRIDSVSIGQSIVINLIAPFDTIIPPRVV